MLELDNVHTKYGKSHVLQGISMSVEDGEIVGLIGRNGAGKTTTLRSIVGIQPPEQGKIRFDGEEIQASSKVAIANKGIRIVLEDRRPFAELTVEQNLKLSVDTSFGDFWDFDTIWREFPELAERRQQKASHLSGGEQQMLVICQALMGNPKLILLDEPFEGLAPKIVDRIIEIIRQINAKGTPILIVDQNLEKTLQLVDRAYVIHKGSIKLSGDREMIMTSMSQLGEYLSV